MSRRESSSKGFVLIAVIYLLGIFIGALDTGIVTPGRTVIQNEFGIQNQLGIWMITIYTLAYAVSIPIMGKMADRHGRKYIYLVSVALFGLGSLFCGLAQGFGSFQILLVARAVQAFGGGGILPVATAEFGTAFPPEKRGMALGLVGAVYGVANVLGSSVGSAILDLFGTGNWPFIFYLNLPFCLFILIAGFVCLPNTRRETAERIDGVGIALLTCMTLSLMYGLKNLDFFDLATSIQTTDVYPFLIAAVVLLPFFILAERHAQDPVMNLAYFRNRDIVITLLIGIITGIVLMGMVFIPQFAENALRLKAGDGGYLIVVLAVFSGIGAPISGKLIDRFGVKVVLGFGLALSAVGSLYLAFVTCTWPNWPNMIVCLVTMGTGMGFTMGTPINYMMLANTDESESNSALATLSLVRSIGTAVAPAIMVAFIAHAGTLVQDRIMAELPTQVTTSPLPYAQELDAEFAKMRSDSTTQALMAGLDIPDLEDMQTIEIDMTGTDGDYTVPDDLTEMMQDADVTTITADSKVFASAMFEQMAPGLIADITDGIDTGTDGMTTARSDMDANIADMQKAADELTGGIEDIDSALAQQQTALDQMQTYLPLLEQVENRTSVLDLMPASAKAAMPQAVLDSLAQVRTAADLQSRIDGLAGAMATVSGKIADLQSARDGIDAGIAGMQGTLATLQTQIAADQETIAQTTDPATLAQLQAKLAGEQQAATNLQAQIDAARAQSADLQDAIAQMDAALASQQQAKTMMEQYLPTLQKLDDYSSVLDLIPDSAKASMPQSALDQLSTVRTSDDLRAKMAELQDAMAQMRDARAQMVDARDQLAEGIAGIRSGQADLDTTLARMAVLKAAIPGTFDEAKATYLEQIDADSERIEEVFQSTLDEGFKGMFILVAICSGIGLVLLFFYREGAPKVAAVLPEETDGE